MTVKLGMTNTQLINAINSDIGLIKDQGSKIITKEFPASETETSSVQLDTKCQGKDYMFVFMDYGILEPSKYSLSADGLTVNFSPVIPANHKLLVRYFSYVNLATIPNGLFLGQIIQVPFGIDESKNIGRYLNGQVIIQDQFPAFTAEVKSWIPTRPSLFTTETEWQQIKSSSKLGQCGKFVVDDTAGTIRLPCVVNAQGLVDLALIGGIKGESLPNIEGSVDFFGGAISDAQSVTGSFKISATGKTGTNIPAGPTSGTTYNLALEAPSAYQDNAPVQQEAIQYPYCIVVNTGVDEAEHPINNYQVNNVYSYGMSQYYKGSMNNNSWLKSAGQWNDGTVYTGMYNWLLEQMNAGISGFLNSVMYAYSPSNSGIIFTLPTLTPKVGMVCYGWSDGSYENIPLSVITAITDDGAFQAEYQGTNYVFVRNSEKDQTTAYPTDYDFVIDTTDQTFRLPLLNESEDLPSDRYDNLTLGASGQTYTAPANGFYRFSVGLAASTYFAIFNGNTGDVADLITNENAAIGQNYVATAEVVKGQSIRIQYVGTPTLNSARFYYTQGNGNLYYYIGDTLQNAQLINVARIEEKLTDMNAPSRGYLVDSYHNGTDWYRVYSDGWIEQGGSVTSNSGLVTYTFMKQFTNTNYGLLCSQNSGGVGSQSNGMVINRVSTTQFSVLFTAGSNDIVYTWRAFGY